MDYVSISFGSGDLEGFFMQDQALLGNPNDTSEALVINNFTFGAVTE